MKGQNTTNRLPVEAPTEPGWYYARVTISVNPEIEPVEVLKTVDGLVAIQTQSMFTRSLGVFTWFGPVATCIEA
jgi:hypothetical protein